MDGSERLGFTIYEVAYPAYATQRPDSKSEPWKLHHDGGEAA